MPKAVGAGADALSMDRKAIGRVALMMR